jgi:hypothetical protein
MFHRVVPWNMHYAYWATIMNAHIFKLFRLSFLYPLCKICLNSYVFIRVHWRMLFLSFSMCIEVFVLVCSLCLTVCLSTCFKSETVQQMPFLILGFMLCGLVGAYKCFRGMLVTTNKIIWDHNPEDHNIYIYITCLFWYMEQKIGWRLREMWAGYKQ